MKLLTKDNEVVEGTLLTEGQAAFMEDLNNNASAMGLILYSHQKRQFIKYMLDHYELTVRVPAPEVEGLEIVEPLLHPVPLAPSATDDDKPF